MRIVAKTKATEKNERMKNGDGREINGYACGRGCGRGRSGGSLLKDSMTFVHALQNFVYIVNVNSFLSDVVSSRKQDCPL